LATKQTIVPVGEYIISKDPACELVTIVGSCIALTLYDQRHQIGGMIHIVLPGRRKKLRNTERHSFYADTGVPFLLCALKESGANIENLEAVIAGGASSYGEYSEHTIGKRNTAAVMSFIKENKILLKSMDVGGRNGRKIGFNLKTGSATIQKITLPILPPQPKPTNKQTPVLNIDPLAEQIEHLKPDENIAGHLLDVVHDHESTTQDLQDIISRDIILAFHIFRLCNSSYYGLPGRITSIFDAIRLLGNRQFRLICVVTATMRQQKESPDSIRSSVFQKQLKQLSRHSYATALIAEQLSFHLYPELKDRAYTAGLLYGIIQFCSLLLKNENNTKVLADNSHLAKTMLTKWNIPKPLIKTITHIKSTLKKDTDSEPIDQLVALAYEISLLLGLEPDNFTCVDKDRLIFSQTTLLNKNLESMMPDIINTLNDADIFIQFCSNTGDLYDKRI